MNRRKLFGLGAAAAAISLSVKDARLPDPIKSLRAEVIPAPQGSLIQGPAVLDAAGNRVGQLIFRVQS